MLSYLGGVPHRNLVVLDAAQRAVDGINRLIDRAPQRLLHVRQMRDSSQSIVANISEGREFKKNAYFALGVQQVWLVDRWTKSIEAWRSRASKNVARTTVAWRAPGGDASMALELEEVFAGID